jgi:hypothetical protein
MADFLAIALRCLLSQVPLGFQFDQLHQLFHDQIALQFVAFLLGKLAVTLSMDEVVGSLSDLGREMERHKLFSSEMMSEQLGQFRCGWWFEQQSHSHTR